METLQEKPTTLSSNSFLSSEAIKMKISVALTKKHGNYNAALNQVRSAVVTKENFKESQEYVKRLTSFIRLVDDFRTEMKAPHLNYGRAIDAAAKEFISPFEVEKNIFQQKLNIIGTEIEREEREKRMQEEKKKAIETEINNFVLDYSVKIASATNNEQLLGYERLINLEKANKSKYANQLSLLIERCNELTSKIKDQKELIKLKDSIEKEKKEAESSGNDAKLEEIIEKEQIIQDKIVENTILVQEIAANNAISHEKTTKNDEVKARRTVWKAEIFDEKEVLKKANDMLDISLNMEKVRQSINTLKAAGVFNGKSEVIINGIRYFQEKTF